MNNDQMTNDKVQCVILAAGQGTRMRSDTHKVLHPIASRPLLLHLLDRVDGLGSDKRIVVVGKGRDQVEQALNGRDVTVAHQAEQKGTGHAVFEERRDNVDNRLQLR